MKNILTFKSDITSYLNTVSDMMGESNLIIRRFNQDFPENALIKAQQTAAELIKLEVLLK
jgi:hypothetical protein